MKARILRTIPSLRKALDSHRVDGKSIGLVPTMGCFHEGHLSLMRRARKKHDIVVVSLFVNPTQFGPSEDFEAYPRNEKRDIAMAKEVGVDYIFAPSVGAMYPQENVSVVSMHGMTDVLCGASRVGHFDGVMMIVCKLFNLVQPDESFFGQKDYQQCKVIQRMVTDLNMPVRVAMCPIVREPDGLAMSSRNTYLSDAERVRATILYRSLMDAKTMIKQGKCSVALITKKIEKVLSVGVSRIEYIEIRNADTLVAVRNIKNNPVVIAVAAKIGKTRLIDNIIVR